MLSAMAPHGREMSRPEKENNLFTQERSRLQKALLISQNTVAKVVQTF